MTNAIAVVVSATSVPAWVHSVLTSLDQHASLDWRQTLVADDPVPTSKSNHGPALRVLAAFDARRHAADIDGALAVCDATSLIASRPRSQIGGSAEVRADTILDLRASDARPLSSMADRDVVRIEIASDSHVGDDAIFWAIHGGQSTCDVRVVIERSHGRGPEVAAVATVGVQPASLLVSRNLCYWKAAALIVEQLARLGDDRAQRHGSERYGEDARDARTPGVVATARVAARQGAAAMRHRWRARGTREQWILGLRVRPEDAVSLDPVGFVPCIPPPDRTFADPFIVQHGTETLLFLEEYEFARGRGVISVMRIDDGVPGEPTVVLERPYHLSYPFVFREGDDHFMIPETAANRTIELYRATDFPHGWVLDDVIAEDVRALDTTLISAGDRYWLLTSIEVPGRNRNDELHLFSSASRRGPWEPHPRNPVVSDVRSTRPAGRPFAHGDALIRPAQDCSGRYGSAIVFRRIDVMDEEDYAEATLATFPPTWTAGLLGAHTFATHGRVDVVDGLRRVPVATTVRHPA